MPPSGETPRLCPVDGCASVFHCRYPSDPRCARCVPESAVDHPSYYGGKDNPYEAIKVIEAWSLGFNLGNAVKYISRAGKKDPAKLVEDLQKAMFYLNREIAKLSEGRDT